MDFSHYLCPLISSKSIAVVGASKRPESVGNFIWDHLYEADFQGVIYPVNPKYKKISDKTCFPSLKEIKDSIDLAVVVSPPSSYLKVLNDCVHKHVKAILLCGGHSRDSLTVAIQKKIQEVSNLGILIAGPQSLGIINTWNRFNASYLDYLPPAGSIGLVSQSPGLTNAIIDFIATTSGGFSSIVDPGFEIGLGVADYIDYLTYDNRTECIVLYLESLKQPRKLFSAIKRASRNKPVLILKGGRTKSSSDIVINNNGIYHSEFTTMELAFKKAGALLVDSLAQLSEMLDAFIYRRHLTEGEFMGIVNSKGLDTLVADNASKVDLQFLTADSQFAKTLNEQYGIAFPYVNPINVGLSMAPKKIADLLNHVLASPNCSAVLLAIASNPIQNSLSIAKAILPVVTKSPKTVISCFVGGQESKDAITFLRKKAIPAFDNTQVATHVLKLMKIFNTFRSYKKNSVETLPIIRSCLYDDARKIITRARKENRNLLYESETKRLLASLGFNTTASLYAGSFGELTQAAKALGYPLAMKISVSGVLSKSDFGGVLLGIRNDEELRDAWENMRLRAENLLISKDDFAVEVQKMISSDHKRELRLGFRSTQQFGPIFYIGLGGFYGKALGTEYFSLIPLNFEDIHELLNKPQIQVLLNKYKGLPSINIANLCRQIQLISELPVEIPALKSLEIDPLLCGSDDSIVLDAHATIGSLEITPQIDSSHLLFPNRLMSQPQVIQTRCGTVQLRVPQPGDYSAFIRYLGSLSDQTLHLRFHTTANNLESLAKSAVFCDLDRQYTVLMIDDTENQSSQIIAEATFSVLPNNRGAEFGISIADQYQAQGLSVPLMNALENEAKRRGLDYLVGYVLNENIHMSKMMKKRGYNASQDENDSRVTLFTLPLN
ncbi:MAG: acetate--CoA ligase family protein [Burkholderiaceae bacterium]|nr:acetate--CoA ligase family protein [Burkholderiaceae bacterium]